MGQLFQRGALHKNKLLGVALHIIATFNLWKHLEGKSLFPFDVLSSIQHKSTIFWNINMVLLKKIDVVVEN